MSTADALLDAIESDDMIAFRQLLDSGVDVNAGDKDNYTALHMAVDFGKVEFARTLLETGRCRVDAATDFHELTALHFAGQDGRTHLAQLLLDYGAGINALNHAHYTPLYFAVCGNHVDTVRLLLSRGADVNIRDAHGMSPLLQAVTISASLTELLLEHRAELSDHCRELHTALISNKADIATVILDRLERPLAINRIGRSPLQNAVAHINCDDTDRAVALVRKLLEFGEDVNYTNQYGSALHILIQRKDFLSNGAAEDVSARELFKCLIARPECDLDQYVATNGGGVPLSLSFRLNQYCFAELLLRAGADARLCRLDDFRYTSGADLALKLLYYSGYQFHHSFAQTCRPLRTDHSACFDHFCRFLETESAAILSLKCLARIALRFMYGSRIGIVVRQLLCPNTLKSFVLLEDVT